MVRFDQRKPNARGHEVEQSQCRLNGSRIRLAEQRLRQLVDCGSNAHGQLTLLALHGEIHAAAQSGHHVRRHRDAAVAALGDEGESGAVIAGDQAEIRADKRAEPRQARHVAGRILEPDNPQIFSQACDRFVGETTGGARRDVVQDQRQPARISDCPEVRLHAGLHRLIVVGHDRQDRIGTGGFGVLGKLDCVAGRV